MAPPGALPRPPALVLRPCPCTARRHAQSERPRRGRHTGARPAELPAGNPSNAVRCAGGEIRRSASVRRANGTAGGTLPPSNGGRASRQRPRRRSGRCRRRRGTDRGDAPAPGFREEEDSPPSPRRCRRPPAVAGAAPEGGGCRQRSGVSRSHAGDGTDGMVPRSPLRIKSHGPPIRTGQARRIFGAFRPKVDHGVSVFGRTATVAAPAILGDGVGHRRPNQRIARRSRPRPVDFRPPAPNPAAPSGARSLPRPSETSGMTGAPGRPIWARLPPSRCAMAVRTADMGAGVGSGFSAEAEGRGGRSPAPHSTMPQAIRETPRPAAAKAASSASRGLRFAPQ